MSGCTPKLKNTCGTMQFATCVYYESAVPLFSSLISEDCYTVEEVLTDIYGILSDIKEELDLSELSANSLDYTLIDGKIVAKEAFKTHASEIEQLKSDMNDLVTGFDGDLDISGWDLDTECLEDACDEPITTLKQLMQAIITKTCTP